MAVRKLPDAVWPTPPNDDSSTSSSSDSFSSSTIAQQPSVLQETLAGSGTVIPILYGFNRVGAAISIATNLGGDLVLCAVWCMGEVNSISVKINDAAPPAGVTVTSYRGTLGQGVDPTLAAAIGGYDDDLIYDDPKYGSVGVAYSVIRIPPGIEEINGFPQVTAEIQGRKVLQPTIGYTTNPVDILANLITDPILGMRRTVDTASQAAARAVCAEVMGDGAKRREVNLVLAEAQDITQWLETLRAYAGCLLFFEGDKAVFIPNRPPASTVDVTATNMEKGSLKLTKKPRTFNVVRVAYTDVSAEPWRTNYALAIHPDVSSGDAAWNEETVSMPGFHNYGQAYREATERLNFYRYSELAIEFTFMEEGLRFSVGDVISVTHPVGLTAVKFRIETLDSTTDGKWRVTGSQYSDSFYSDAAPTAPAFPNIQPPNSEDSGITDTPGSSLTLVEIFTTLSDGTPISKIQATWTPVTHPNFSKYEIQWKAASASGWNTDFSVTATWLSPQVTVANTYTVRVRTLATDGAVGAWLEDTIAILGKTSTGYSPPAAPSGVTGNLYVELVWSFPAGATDIAYTEVWVATSNNFSSAILTAKVAYPGNRFLLGGLAAGVCRFFWVKFADTSGNITGTYPTSPTGGTQLCTPSTGADLLSYLSGQIQQTHLNTTLSTKIDNASSDASTALIEVGQLATEVYGEYYVKIDVNGYVAGFGLWNSGPGASGFLIKADSFAIGSNTDISPVGDQFPFIVSGGKAYMKAAYIQDLTVTNAKIANLTLSTGKLVDNAISSASGTTLSDMTFSGVSTTYTFNNVASVTGDNIYAALRILQFMWERNIDHDQPWLSGSLTVTLNFSGKYGGSATYAFGSSTFAGGLITICRPAYVTPTADPTSYNMSVTFTGSGTPNVLGGYTANYVRAPITGLYVWRK